MHPNMETQVELTLFSGSGGCKEGWGRICGGECYYHDAKRIFQLLVGSHIILFLSQSGESCVKVYLKNPSNEEGYVGLTPNFPAKVVPIKFGVNVRSGSALIAQGGAIMTQLGDVGKCSLMGRKGQLQKNFGSLLTSKNRCWLRF
jgi:hypothetical protein